MKNVWVFRQKFLVLQSIKKILGMAFDMILHYKEIVIISYFVMNVELMLNNLLQHEELL